MELVKGLLKLSGVEHYCNTTVTNIKPANESKDGVCVVTCKASGGAGKAGADGGEPARSYRAKRVIVSVAANQAAAFNQGKGLPVSKKRKASLPAYDAARQRPPGVVGCCSCFLLTCALRMTSSHSKGHDARLHVTPAVQVFLAVAR